MKRKSSMLVAVLAVLCIFSTTPLSAQKYVSLKKMSQTTEGSVRYSSGQALSTPLIAWGGDEGTVLANGGKTTQSGSIVNKNGLSLNLYREDIFQKQLDNYMSGKSPFLRGTVGMLLAASEVTEKSANTKMVVFHQMTWSSGGDALVVRKGINTLKDLKGKTIAIQMHGPHVAWLMTLLKSANLKPSDVTIKWCKDLTDESQGAFSPVKALQTDGNVDAAFCIIPDGLLLTLDGTVGDGSEGSVKGAKILVTSKDASRVIADCYAVRSDFYKAHPDVVQKFSRALLEGQESLIKMMSNPSGTNYRQFLTMSADILRDDSGLTEDIIGMYGDCEFVGLEGNRRFLGTTYARRFDVLAQEVQKSYIQLKLVSKVNKIQVAKLDYNKLGKGLSLIKDPLGNKKMDRNSATRAVDMQKSAGGEAFLDFEIQFEPNQSRFEETGYEAQFDSIIHQLSIYRYSVVELTGHSDPSRYIAQKKQNVMRSKLNQIRLSAKNLSSQRAEEVMFALIRRAKSQGVQLTEDRFVISGQGITKPKKYCRFENGDLTVECYPEDPKQFAENLRVEVSLRGVSGDVEFEEFVPLNELK